MVLREQVVFENNSTRYIAYLSRLVNLVEDIVDDAYCSSTYIGGLSLYDYSVPDRVYLEPIDCVYDPVESLEVFSSQWEIDNVFIGRGSIDYRELYRLVYNVYRSTLHYKMKEYSVKSSSLSREYYLAVLFNGKAFIVEGERDRVALPVIPHCVSAHTHPTNHPYPSKHDIESIINMMVNRGLLHAIETTSHTLYVYRVKPLCEEDIVKLRLIEGERDYRRVADLFKSIESLRIVLE